MKTTTAFYRQPLAEALRYHTGRQQGGKPIDPDLSDETGISPRRLYAMRDGDADVSIDELGALIRALPGDFSARALKPYGVAAVSKADDPDPNPHALNAGLADAIQAVADKLRDDGKVDHREVRQLIPKMRDARELIDNWLAAHVEPADISWEFERKRAAKGAAE